MPLTRSEMMSRIGGKDTRPEQLVRAMAMLLWILTSSSSNLSPPVDRSPCRQPR